ncbi:MAG: NAD(P)H-dependent oxidoreductase [Thermoanaerobaculia bacterium]
MSKVLVLFAHPRLEKSRANAALLRHLPRNESITFRDLYEIYPDFDVDIAEEQQILLAHDVLVWHHPFYWYSLPPLAKQWIDLVLAYGWAYGSGGTQLHGKSAMHVVTVGGAVHAYEREGFHGYTIAEFLRPLQRTATLCGMNWLDPFVVYGTNRMTAEGLEEAGRAYGAMLTALAAGTTPAALAAAAQHAGVATVEAR